MKVEVTKNVSDPRAVGKGTVREQEIWVQVAGQRYPQKSALALWDQDEPLEEGEYVFDCEAAVYVGQYDRLQLSMRLEHFKRVADVKSMKG